MLGSVDHRWIGPDDVGYLRFYRVDGCSVLAGDSCYLDEQRCGSTLRRCNRVIELFCPTVGEIAGERERDHGYGDTRTGHEYSNWSLSQSFDNYEREGDESVGLHRLPLTVETDDGVGVCDDCFVVGRNDDCCAMFGIDLVDQVENRGGVRAVQC